MAITEITVRSKPRPVLMGDWIVSAEASKADALQIEQAGGNFQLRGNIALRTLRRLSQKERDTKAIGKLAAMLLHPSNPSRDVTIMPFLSIPDETRPRQGQMKILWR